MQEQVIPTSVVSGVDHVALVVGDAEASSRRLRELFGWLLSSDEMLGHLNVRLLHLDAGNVDIQLVQPYGPGAIADHLAEHGEGLHHVCLVAPQLDLALAAIEPEAVSRVFPGGRERPACFLTERPSGLLVELVQDSSVPILPL